MRILILNWRDIKNPSSGGAEILTHELAKYWVVSGHTVTQFSSNFPGGREHEIIDSVKIIRRGHPDARQLFTSVHFLAFWYYQTHKNEFDIIIDEIHGIPFFTPLYVTGKKVGLICEVADNLWKEAFGPFFGFLGWVVEKLYLRFVYKTTPLLTISQSTQEDLIANGVNKDHVTVLPMGISLPTPLPRMKRNTKKVLLFVGRLTKPKGVEDALYALKEIRKTFPDITLWIIGRGEETYVSYLHKLTGRLRVAQQVAFLGFVSDRKKFEYMGKAFLLVHPSIREGFGLTIPEAGFMGTPVVAYNAPGTRDVVKDKINGILLSENTPTFLAKEITQLIENEGQYKRLCRGAKQESQDYRWEKTAKMALTVLEGEKE